MGSKCIPIVGLLISFLVFFLNISELSYVQNSRLHALMNTESLSVHINQSRRKVLRRFLEADESSDDFPLDFGLINKTLDRKATRLDGLITTNDPVDTDGTAQGGADEKLFKCTFTTTQGARLCQQTLKNMVKRICDLVPADVRSEHIKSIKSLSLDDGINGVRSNQNHRSRERLIAALASGNGKDYRFWIGTLFSQDVISIISAIMAALGSVFAILFLILPWTTTCTVTILRRRKFPKSILKNPDQYNQAAKESSISKGKKVQFNAVDELHEPSETLDNPDNKNIPLSPTDSEIGFYRHQLFSWLTPNKIKWTWIFCGTISFIFLTVSFALSLRTALNRGKQVRINLQMAKCVGATEAYSALFNEKPTDDIPFLGFEKLNKVYQDVQLALPLYKTWATSRDSARILSEAAALIMSPIKTTDYLLNRQSFYWNDVPINSLRHRSVAALAYPLIASEHELTANLGTAVENANNTDTKEKHILAGLEAIEHLMRRSMNIMHEISSSISVMFHHPYMGFNRDSSKHFMVAISSFAWLSFLPFLALVAVWVSQSVALYGKIDQDELDPSQDTDSQIRAMKSKIYRMFMLSMGFMSLLCGEALFILLVIVSLTSRGLRDACGYVADDILTNGDFRAFSSTRTDFTHLGSACFAHDATGDILEAAASILEFEQNLPDAYNLNGGHSNEWRPHYAAGLKFILDLEDYLFSNMSSSKSSRPKIKLFPERQELLLMAHPGLIISASGTGIKEFPITSLDLQDITVDCFDNESSRVLCGAIFSEHPTLYDRNQIVIRGIWSTLNHLEEMMPDQCRVPLCLGGDHGNCFEDSSEQTEPDTSATEDMTGSVMESNTGNKPPQLLKTTPLTISPKTIRYVDLSQTVLKRRTKMHLTAKGAAAAACFEELDPVGHQKWAVMVQEMAIKSIILSEPIRFLRKHAGSNKDVASLKPHEVFPDTCPIRQPCPLFMTLQQQLGTPLTSDPSKHHSLHYTLADYRTWSTNLIDTLKHIPDELTQEEALELLKGLSFSNSFIQPLRAFLDFIHQQIDCTQLRKSSIHASYAVCHQTLSQFEQLRLPFCILALFDYVTFAYIFAIWWKTD